MTPIERNLNHSLRILSETGPQEAPPHVEQALRAAFRERRSKRRVKRRMEFGGAVIAIAASLAVIAIMRPVPPTSGPVPEKMQPRGDSNTVQHFARVEPHSDRHARPRRRAVTKGAAQDSSEFFALPGADATIPLEHATVVRVQLPLSAFREIGLAVNEQSAAGQVQADVLLGQDGLARAVRFVQ